MDQRMLASSCSFISLTRLNACAVKGQLLDLAARAVKFGSLTL